MNSNHQKSIHFIKMHGLGNDYIFVDTTINDLPNPQAAAIAWSRPHFGIGSDGVVLIGRSSTPDADFTMRFFNADGSEGQMCGNASRCIGKYV
ncbi:MAG: diaminopimelate epimerase, partial [Muribaculaceae bacterium]|nr:diaminopimelate epimerase [Muribaculaceae bacterium]